MGKHLDLLVQALGMQALDRLHDGSMERAAAILQQRAISDVVGERVLEGVFQIREKPRLVQELRRLQLRERTPQIVTGEFRNCVQQHEWHILADDGCCLQQSLELGLQPIDARC